MKRIYNFSAGPAVSLLREVRVVDKNSIEVTFDFDDSYRERLDNLGRLGYEIDSDRTGNGADY